MQHKITNTFFYFPFNYCAVKARKESRNNGYEKEEKPPKCIFACLLCFIPLKQKKPTKTRTVHNRRKNLKEGLVALYMRHCHSNATLLILHLFVLSFSFNNVHGIKVHTSQKSYFLGPN